MTHRPSNLGVPIPDHVRGGVRALIDAVGEREAVRRLGISRMALARVVGGLGVRRGTLALCELGLRGAQPSA